MMNITTMSSARSNLFNIAETVINTHEPFIMTGKHGNVVLISEADFRAIQETLNLQVIPNLVKDVKAGRKASKKTLATRKDLPWS